MTKKVIDEIEKRYVKLTEKGTARRNDTEKLIDDNCSFVDICIVEIVKYEDICTDENCPISIERRRIVDKAFTTKEEYRQVLIDRKNAEKAYQKLHDYLGGT